MRGAKQGAHVDWDQMLIRSVAVLGAGTMGAQIAAHYSEVVDEPYLAEESGRLDQELVRIANVTENDLDRQLKSAVALAEPLMLFFIAGFIGTIFIGMVIPIFTLQDYIK